MEHEIYLADIDDDDMRVVNIPCTWCEKTDWIGKLYTIKVSDAAGESEFTFCSNGCMLKWVECGE